MSKSSNGMKTRIWGPHAWDFLFCSIAGAYPVRLDYNNKDHVKTMKKFHAMMKSLEYTLPCFWCRHSFGGYLKEFPLEDYSSSRKDMMKWLYLVHDRVNKKLIQQEHMKFEKQKEALMTKKLTKAQLQSKLKDLKSSIFITKQSPTFASVLAKYEKYRA